MASQKNQGSSKAGKSADKNLKFDVEEFLHAMANETTSNDDEQPTDGTNSSEKEPTARFQQHTHEFYEHFNNGIADNLKTRSEIFYIDTVRDIVRTSKTNLNAMRDDKERLRVEFVSFFKLIIAVQLVFLLILILANGYCNDFNVSDTVLATFMTSIFVETIGCVLVMVTFAFKSTEVVEIISTLNTVVETFQKFTGGTENKDSKGDK